MGGLTAHYAWYLGAAFSLLPITKALLYLLASQAFCGFLLSIVFVQSHNGMEASCLACGQRSADVVVLSICVLLWFYRHLNCRPFYWQWRCWLPLFMAGSCPMVLDAFTSAWGQQILLRRHIDTLLPSALQVYSTNKDFVTAQIVSTRDISSGLFEDWFTGGLNYQIEHHLFPSLPRHNLGRVQKDVQALCEKHALLYESCSIAEGTRRVLKRLAEVAEQA